MMQLKSYLNDYCQGFESQLFSRGSAGLLAFFRGLKALHGKGEVIIPSVCCETVAMAAMYAGLETVFCDISKETLCATEATIGACVNEKTLAVVAVHAFGNICNVGDLMTTYPHIYFVEDVAQAVGGVISGVNVGSTMDCTLLSFSHGKIIHGEGGAMVFRTDKCRFIFDWIEKNHSVNPMPEREYAQKELSLRNISHSVYDIVRSENGIIAPSYYRRFINKYYSLLDDRGFAMPEKQVIDGLAELPRMRRLRYEKYMKYVDGIDNPGITIIKYSSDLMVWRMSLIMSSADSTWRLSLKLRDSGIPVSNHYFPLSVTMGCGANAIDRIAIDRVINLWVDESTTDKIINDSTAIINKFSAEER